MKITPQAADVSTPFAGYPKGEPFTVLTPQTYRWAKYKPDGQRQMKAEGRWQKAVWHGDYFKWENCEAPANGLQIIDPSLATPSPDYRALLEMAVEALKAYDDWSSLPITKPFGPSSANALAFKQFIELKDHALTTLTTIKTAQEGK